MAYTDRQDPGRILKTALRERRPERLYIFCGEETFLLSHYLQMLRKALLDELTESFNCHRLTQENFDIRAFADAVENLPMMAERTLVQVDDVDIFKLSEDERNKIADIIQDIPEYCTVVFTYITTAWKPDKRLKKLWEPVESKAVILEFEKQDTRVLTDWLIRHFAHHGKRIDPKLCAYLIEITDGTMTTLGSEVSKIAAYSGADVICKADIDAVTEPALSAQVFQMANMLVSGDGAGALITLQKLLKMQEDPLRILGAIGSQFRSIGAARVLLDSGKGYGELMKLYRMQDYAARKTMDSARRVTPEFCRTASRLILETDYQIKTSFDDTERLMELLVLRLAQEARHA